MQPGAIFGLGPLELAIIIGVIVILFLPAILPKLAKRLGETFTTIKDMTSKAFDEGDEDKKDKKDSTEAGEEPRDKE
jgi:sec-independent protein translocase protein TatA